jgi:hypothetical protein
MFDDNNDQYQAQNQENNQNLNINSRTDSDFSDISNLSQQDVQNIVMHMFQLFIQNVQEEVSSTSSHEKDQDASKDYFKASDVRFFDSQLNSSYEFDDVIQIDRDVYYRDVYLFVERIKDAIILSEEDVIKANLFSCLRDTTQI